MRAADATITTLPTAIGAEKASFALGAEPRPNLVGYFQPQILRVPSQLGGIHRLRGGG
jgi:hypothetical protein